MMVTKNQNSVTNSGVYSNKGELVTYFSNYISNSNSFSNISELVTFLENLVTNLKVTKSKTKMTIIFMLLVTKVGYFQGFRKVLQINPSLLQRSLEDLLSAGIIEEVPPSENLKEKEIFKSVIRKKTTAGDFHAKKAKFYRLTPFYEEIFSKFIHDFTESLDDEILKRIYNFQREIRKTHEQIARELEKRNDTFKKALSEIHRDDAEFFEMLNAEQRKRLAKFYNSNYQLSDEAIRDWIEKTFGYRLKTFPLPRKILFQISMEG
jgi:hypothetical protein